MKYFIIEPEVPGNIGPRTIMERSSQPPSVESLHFVFEGWLGDQLVESFPCWLISKPLVQLFKDSQITGWTIEDADIEFSRQFYEVGNREALPEFKWLLVNGRPNIDDLCISTDYRLQVSEKALSVILTTNPQMMDVFPLQS